MLVALYGERFMSNIYLDQFKYSLSNDSNLVIYVKVLPF